MERREFLANTALATVGSALSVGVPVLACGPELRLGGGLPAAIATWKFGQKATATAGKVLLEGGSSLDAVEKGINTVELDPMVNSVGYGGLPNEDGVVQLDAMIMYGPTHAAGAVASLEEIATPISVARQVMELGKPTFLVGPGARDFAVKNGFKRQDLLTLESKKKWEEWKKRKGQGTPPSHDTVGVVAIDREGRVTAGCSTSGLSFKKPGRVGDSPVIGAGAYCDNDVGGAAATGNGDLMIRFCLTFHVVELMREGLSPPEACRAALERMIKKNARTSAAIVALNKKGEFGAAQTGEPFHYAIWNKTTDQLLTIRETKE